MITVLARSARKSKRRYIGGLDIFCHDEIFIKGDPRGRPYLTELAVLNSFPLLRDNLEKMLAAGKMVQWVRKLADATTPMPAVYSLLGQTLALIEKEDNSERLELMGLVFRLKLLDQLGLKPRVEACVKCGNAETPEVIFEVESGGVVCRNCSTNAMDRLALGQEERRFLDLADRFRLTAWPQLQFPLQKTRHLLSLITQFASFHTHLKLPG